MPYGYELILDLHRCDVSRFGRDSLREYFAAMCKELKMEPCDLHFWDDHDVPADEQQTSPQTKGTSAVQFILTSSIVVHTLDLLTSAYINIFSCKGFDRYAAKQLTVQWFGAADYNETFLERQ